MKTHLPHIKTTTLLAAAVTTLAAFSSSAHASVITTPAGLSVGQPFYVVFVSDTLTTAASSDHNYYDSLVQTDATTADVTYQGDPVTFQALVSTADGTVANARFNPASGIGIYMVDGTKIADDGADLWDGSIDTGINLDPSGLVAVEPYGAWTGTDGSGNADSGVPAGGDPDTLGHAGPGYFTAGNSIYSNIGWTQAGWDSVNTANGNIYAFSEELIAPEPSSLALLGLAGVTLLRRRHRASSASA